MPKLKKWKRYTLDCDVRSAMVSTDSEYNALDSTADENSLCSRLIADIVRAPSQQTWAKAKYISCLPDVVSSYPR
jgi:hypothetical protein